MKNNSFGICKKNESIFRKMKEVFNCFCILEKWLDIF